MSAVAKGSNVGIIEAITAPLGFYVLSLLIVEGSLVAVLTGDLTADQRWTGVFCMLGVFVLVLLIVTALVIWFPKNLVFGKEEHSSPHTDPLALRDQIEDLIHERVKPECLDNVRA